MQTLDCRGQQCPQPVIQTRRQLLAHPEQPLRVLVDDSISRDNISRLATSLGYHSDVREENGLFQLDLLPGDGVQESAAAPASGPTIVLVASEQMGSGDVKLGQILMKNFIFTMAEGGITPDAIYFLNSGVKLTVGGSDVVEPLEKLACSGVDIASCGLCLEFFGLKDALAVGRISNMLEIVNSLHGAGRIIRP
ncbi:MAG: sulfurtransferase-like selenium metabolism protein YedF [Desulfuromonadales bacterium]|nr:sulfurtransferase-like selenium metabolism protein YedF [Desulfuromonadales bacterium]